MNERKFRQWDVVRAAKAAGQAGLGVERIDVREDGSFSIVTSKKADAESQAAALDAWMAERARSS